MTDLIIYGSGSVGRMAEQIVFDINSTRDQWRIIGFIDDDAKKHGSKVAGYPVLGNIDALQNYRGAYTVPAFSTPKHKLAAAEKLHAAGANIATLVHPSAWISRRVKIGEGSIIYPGVHIDVDVEIGRYVLLNKLCTIGHDTVFGDYATAAPAVNIGGNCRIGDGVEFGINSAMIQGVSVGAWSVIGGGAIVVRDIPANTVAYGVPAKAVSK